MQRDSAMPDPSGPAVGGLVARLGNAPLLALPYPLSVARTLIQIGHEPLPPRHIRWFGKEYYAWPSAVGYVRYIYQCEGVRGMYRGFTAKVVETVLYGHLRDSLAHSLALSAGVSEPIDKSRHLTREHAWQFAKELAVEVVANCTATCITFPLNVVNVRMIAEFVGKEQIYSNFVRGLMVLARETDAEDFMQALVPALIREALLASFWVMARHLVAYFNPYDRDEIRARRERRQRRRSRALQVPVRVDAEGYVTAREEALEDVGSDDSDLEDEMEELLASQQGSLLLQNVVHMIPSPYTYPLLHASTRMCLRGSGLAAATSPYLPRYGSWHECLRALYSGGPNLAYMGSRLLNIRRIPDALLPALALA